MATEDISKEVKLLFIQEELSQHGEFLADLFVETLEKNHSVDTGELLDSINYDSFSEGENPGLKFNFFSYGRAVDIMSYKQNRHAVDTNKVVWGMKEPKMKKKSWYAKSMYQGLYRLYSRIMYGLSDAEIARLKGILENRKNISL